ncbi:tetratricopeptide repeat protein [Simiduia agarivorans]|uniref:tetratricopeptide repeat protein n=1 Tax=Simiduia agarivorans TaxID=447471 RepID=UPI001183C5D5|nr:tetratricopeptide repeat protein [Simiduia agarivorans]
MRRSWLLLGLAWCASLGAQTRDYVGSQACKSCHAQEYTEWQSSDHHGAMQPATAEWVLGDFGNHEFRFGGVVSRFFQRDGKYWVTTDNAAGELQTFQVLYTLGVRPLQQYVIDTGSGRYQMLTIAWDARPKTDGGQRWFHLQTEQDAAAGSPLHWTGTFYNWNTRCAACHTTNLKKHYATTSKTYNTQWDEVTVGCEACHGPAAQHVKWAAKPDAQVALKGFLQSLDDRGDWAMPKDSHTLKRTDGLRPQQQLTQCAHCHSRRQQITEAAHGEHYLDHHQTQFLAQGLYHPDGQILDEVFVFDSFLQSKMHGEGVVCSNCHNPHSGKLRSEGNGVCLQCHEASTFNVTAHHKHPVETSGGKCANCHMPETTYMVVDPRRDHSIRIPRPDLSDALNTPNACIQCHTEKSNAWAAEAAKKWWGTMPAHWGETLHSARAGNAGALPDLLAIAESNAYPLVVRATALQQAGDFPSGQVYQQAVKQLQAKEPALRLAAVRALAFLPANGRQVLYPLMQDPIAAVRLAVALPMAEIPEQQIPGQWRKARQQLITEYIDLQLLHADTPSAQLNLGTLYLAVGDAVMAEAAFNEALRITPAYIPALLNLADLLRFTGRDAQGLSLLERAITAAPENANAHHALGLYRIRQRQLPEAINSLANAYSLAPENIRFGYVYAVALHSAGDKAKAVDLLRKLQALAPENNEVGQALKAYGG